MIRTNDLLALGAFTITAYAPHGWRRSRRIDRLVATLAQLDAELARASSWSSYQERKLVLREWAEAALIDVREGQILASMAWQRLQQRVRDSRQPNRGSDCGAT